jgi:hypothetical protein
MQQLVRELEDITRELARRAGHNVNRRKKQRTNVSSEPTEAGEQSNPSLPMGDSTSHLVSSNLASASYPSFPDPSTTSNEISTRPHHNSAIPTPTFAGSSSSGTLPVPQSETMAITISPSHHLTMKQSEIEKLIRALMSVLTFRFQPSIDVT